MPPIKLIDAHSHINFNGYKDDADAVISRATDAGIAMLAVGSQSTTSARAVDYAEKYPHIWAAIGLHPTHLFASHVDEEEIAYDTKIEAFDPEFYRSLVNRSKKVVAIGECGLEYSRVPEGVTMEEMKSRQQEGFRWQCDLALAVGLPIMVHCRDAHDDLARILEEYATAGKPLRGNIHCFTGTWPEAKRYLDLGFYISFTGIVTFTPKASQRALWEGIQEAVKKIPLDRMLVETDAPYLAPVPFRGKRNEPAYVQHVANYIASVRMMEVEEVERQTLKNTCELFGIRL